MGTIYDIALWMNEIIDQMGLWATAPFILGVGLVGLKIGKLREGG